jgi:hypothetical protein
MIEVVETGTGSSRAQLPEALCEHLSAAMFIGTTVRSRH